MDSCSLWCLKCPYGISCSNSNPGGFGIGSNWVRTGVPIAFGLEPREGVKQVLRERLSKKNYHRDMALVTAVHTALMKNCRHYFEETQVQLEEMQTLFRKNFENCRSLSFERNSKTRGKCRSLKCKHVWHSKWRKNIPKEKRLLHWNLSSGTGRLNHVHASSQCVLKITMSTLSIMSSFHSCWNNSWMEW